MSLLYCLILSSTAAFAIEKDSLPASTLRLTVRFRCNSSVLEEDFRGNGKALRRFVEAIESGENVAWPIEVSGTVSPEGGLSRNKRLAEDRARATRKWLIDHTDLALRMVKLVPVGVDWSNFVTLLEESGDCPYRDDILEIVGQALSDTSDVMVARTVARLKALHDGLAWEWLEDYILGDLRISEATVRVRGNNLGTKGVSGAQVVNNYYCAPCCPQCPHIPQCPLSSECPRIPCCPLSRQCPLASQCPLLQRSPQSPQIPQEPAIPSPGTAIVPPLPIVVPAPSPAVTARPDTIETLEEDSLIVRRHRRVSKLVETEDTVVVSRERIMAIRSNLLLPLMNVGVEYPISKHWSIEADWNYPWIWPRKANKDCIEMLALCAGARWWMRDPKDKTWRGRTDLTGPSLGITLLLGYYDFERNYEGGQGEFGGLSVDFTWAILLGRRGRAHMEFTIGAGYLYTPSRTYHVEREEGKLLYDERHVNHWLGPTRAAVSIVFPISRKVKDKPSKKK